jgi:hypothetical protein
MSPEDTLKRAFPALLVLPVAAIAYFQGSGVAALLADAWLPPEVHAPRARAAVPIETATRSADAIIAQNPFDHSTDLQLTAAVELAPAAPIASRELDVSDPLHAEACADVSVEIVSEARDPTESIAVLQQQEDSSGVARRVGDALGDYRVEYIGFNRLEHSPAVWLSQDAELCQAVLFGEEPDKPGKSKAKATDRAARVKAAQAKAARAKMEYGRSEGCWCGVTSLFIS